MVDGEATNFSDISLHTFIISWPGFEAKASKIEHSLPPRIGKVHVIHSPGNSSDFEIPPHWVVLPDDSFYGAKFLKSLELCSSDVMLQIQADADSVDWPEVIRQCQSAFAENHDLGLWAPLVDWTPWSLSRTSLDRQKKDSPQRVSMVDGIVWALGTKTLRRLRELDFSVNPLGRGIDLAAASFVMANGQHAIVDPRVRVTHPRGSGYSEADANHQLHVFLTQLNSLERVALHAIQELQVKRVQREKRSPAYIANKLFRKVFDPLYKVLSAFPKISPKRLS